MNAPFPLKYSTPSPLTVIIRMDCGIRVHGSDYTRPRYTSGDDWNCNGT